MDIELLQLVINTLESVEIVSTENNLSRMLASIQTLKKMIKDSQNGGEQNA